MSRINPIPRESASIEVKNAFEQHVADYAGSRITNMKATLGHSLVAFEVYMQWYPLYEKVKEILGNRLAYLYAHAISEASNCPLCTTFFRKIIIENGEQPEDLQLSDYEQLLINFGSVIAQQKGEIPDALYHPIQEKFTIEQVVVLVAFAGQMIATNILNNVLQVEIDEYLYPYLPITPPNSFPSHV